MGKVINVQMDEDFYNQIIQGGGYGNGSGNEESSDWRYFDMAKLKGSAQMIVGFFTNIIKTSVSSTYGKPLFLSAIGIMNGGMQDVQPSNFVAVPTNIPMTYESAEIATFKEACIKYDVTEEELSVAEITKEQFYNLE